MQDSQLWLVGQSRRHSKVLSGSLLSNSNVAEVEFVGSAGPDVMVAVGGVRSINHPPEPEGSQRSLPILPASSMVSTDIV